MTTSADVDLLRCAARLHVGKKVSDEEFDSVYGGRERAVSFRHWTPVAVACRAARLLTDMGATRILDVGAGVGKFCIVGALTTSADYCGVERRGNLVDIARAAAAQFGAARTDVHARQHIGLRQRPFRRLLHLQPLRGAPQVRPGPDRPRGRTIPRSLPNLRRFDDGQAHPRAPRNCRGDFQRPRWPDALPLPARAHRALLQCGPRALDQEGQPGGEPRGQPDNSSIGT